MGPISSLRVGALSHSRGVFFFGFFLGPNFSQQNVPTETQTDPLIEDIILKRFSRHFPECLAPILLKSGNEGAGIYALSLLNSPL